MLNEDKNEKLCEFIENKTTVKNVLSLYSLAKIHKLGDGADLSLKYIERCFPVVVESKNFMHFDFRPVAKTLASSELNIHSEM